MVQKGDTTMIARHIKFFTLTGATLLSLTTAAWADNHIGTATFTEGTVLVERSGAEEAAPLNTGDMIYLNDNILTDEGDYATISFVDETSITLNGEDGSFTIDEYIYDVEAPENNKARFNVLRASFVYVSGAIGKTEKPDVKIGLDFGTIGIRGTKILRSMKENECWILLEDGKIQVSNSGGTVNMKPGDGTRMRATNIGPTRPEPWSEKNIAWINREVALPTVEKEINEE